MITEISQIKPNPKNPRRISEERLNRLGDDLSKFGDLSGVVVNSDGTIISAHQRMRHFAENGGRLIVTDRYERALSDGTVSRGFIEISDGTRFIFREVDWPIEKADEATIVANIKFGEWDADALSSEWGQYDLGGWGLTENDWNVEPEAVPHAAEDDGFAIPEQIETTIVRGDIIQIGNHRLLCGDSTDSGDIERLMNGGGGN